MRTTVKLGPRLASVASFVPAGAKLGDIGTDHAYLPIALIEADQIKMAIGVDVHEGPFQSALSAVKSRHLEANIDVRFGDGLCPIKPGEVNTLTIAGMGGKTMLDILLSHPDVLESVTNLILQPQGAEGTLRLALLERGWHLKAECLAGEDNRIYSVIVFSRQEGWDSSELKKTVDVWSCRLNHIRVREGIESKEFKSLVQRLVWYFGPFILECRTNLLMDYLDEHRETLLRRVIQMKKSHSLEIETKIREVSNELVLVEGLRIWQ